MSWKPFVAVVLCALFAVACKTNAPQVAERGAVIPGPLVPEAPSREAFTCEESDVAWPMFQRSAARHGRSAAPAIRAPRVAWSQPIGIASWRNNPVIANGRVFAPSSGDVWNRADGADGVYAFDLVTGEAQWFAATEDDATEVAYQNCRVFVGSEGGSVQALGASDGRALWSVEFGSKIYALLPLGDRVIVGGDQVLVALEASTGEVLWRSDVAGAVRGGLAADDLNVYVTTDQASVLAVTIDQGERLWRRSLRTESVVSIYGAPTVVGDRLYVGFVRDTYYDTPAVWRIDTASGETAWEGSNPNALGGWANVRSSPAYDDGRLFWGEAYSNRIATLDAADGVAVGSVATGLCTFPHWPSPAIAQHQLYLPRHDGTLYAYDIESSTVVWSLFIGDGRNVTRDVPPEHLESDACHWEPPHGKPIYASPAIASDGSLAITTGDGWLHVIRDAVE